MLNLGTSKERRDSHGITIEEIYHDISADRGDIRGNIKYDVYVYVYIYMILSKIDQPVTVDVSPLSGYIWDPYALTHYI